jgi:predicted metal-dependent hydrolase
VPEHDASHTWHVRRDPDVDGLRIVVSAVAVTIVAPPDASDDAIGAFVTRHETEIAEAARAIHEARTLRARELYEDGSKVPYRGRRLTLNVAEGDVDEVGVAYRGSFHVTVPRNLSDEDRPAAVRRALLSWMTGHASRDAERWADAYGERLGLPPTTVRLFDHRSRWGTVLANGEIRIHWRLVQAPSTAMEYCVAHTVTHRVEPDHTDRFWETLSGILPDWQDRRARLERWSSEAGLERHQV